MPLVDYEAVVLDLEREVRSKNSHGQRELLAKIADLRIKHRQIEGLPERALRLYGSDLAQALTRPATEGAVAPEDMESEWGPSQRSNDPDRRTHAGHSNGTG